MFGLIETRVIGGIVVVAAFLCFYWLVPRDYRDSATLPSILFISVDTLRADHLSSYGYGRPTSPNIDRLASEGALFRNAISQAPWTLPSLASLFTSTYPFEHRAGRRLQAGEATQSTSFYSRLSDDKVTLAELLKQAGYSTQAFVANLYLENRFGLGQGYDSNIHSSEAAEPLTDRAIAWLESNREKPFFLYVHYMDPHKPYRAPRHFNTKVRNPANNRVLLYDAEIAYTDHHIGRLLEAFDTPRVARARMIVFVADHGENHFDHGYNGHGLTLYDEEVRVPLVMVYRGVIPQTLIDTQVSLLDVLPTILEYLKRPPLRDIRGRSLRPLIDRVESEARPVFSDSVEVAYGDNLSFPTEEKYAVRGEFKYIFAPGTGTRELYHLSVDPGETTNLAGRDPARVEVLHGQLLCYIEEKRRFDQRAMDGKNAVPLDAAAMEELRALGYVE